MACSWPTSDFSLLCLVGKGWDSLANALCEVLLAHVLCVQHVPAIAQQAMAQVLRMDSPTSASTYGPFWDEKEWCLWSNTSSCLFSVRLSRRIGFFMALSRSRAVTEYNSDAFVLGSLGCRWFVYICCWCCPQMTPHWLVILLVCDLLSILMPRRQWDFENISWPWCSGALSLSLSLYIYISLSLSLSHFVALLSLRLFLCCFFLLACFKGAVSWCCDCDSHVRACFASLHHLFLWSSSDVLILFDMVMLAFLVALGLALVCVSSYCQLLDGCQGIMLTTLEHWLLKHYTLTQSGYRNIRRLIAAPPHSLVAGGILTNTSTIINHDYICRMVKGTKTLGPSELTAHETWWKHKGKHEFDCIFPHAAIQYETDIFEALGTLDASSHHRSTS